MREIKLAYFNLYTTVKDIIKNILFIVLAMWIGFSASRLYCTYMKSKTYSSEVIVSVNYYNYTSSAEYSTLKTTVSLASNLTKILNDPTLKNIIVEKSGKPINSVIQAEQIAGTNFIKLTSWARSPKASYVDLMTLLDNQDEVTRETISRLSLNIVKNPSVTVIASTNTSDLIMQIEYALLGGLIAVLIIVVLSYNRDTIKNESDIENLLGLETFGVIYNEPAPKKEKKSKAYHLLPNHTTGYLFNHSFSQMAIKLESLKRTGGVSSVLVTSVFESEGKTTVSTNLACALAADGNKVAIVDTDFKCPSVYERFKGVSTENDHDVARYIKGELSLEDVTQYDKDSGVYVYCNAKVYKNSLERLRTDVFRDFISELEKMYDFVILDTSPSGLVADSEMISRIASTILLVVAQDYTDVNAINDTIDNLGSDRILGCVFNKVGEFKRVLKNKYMQLNSI